MADDEKKVAFSDVLAAIQSATPEQIMQLRLILGVPIFQPYYPQPPIQSPQPWMPPWPQIWCKSATQQ